MRKLFFTAMCACMLLSSCATRVFQNSEMQSHYESRMTSKKEKALKQDIRIFLSEKEVPNNFEVISIVRYRPFHFPIFWQEYKKVRKKMYKNAVTNADKQGGNGVIIMDSNHYKVIKY